LRVKSAFAYSSWRRGGDSVSGGGGSVDGSTELDAGGAAG
jgi:hypothetical protein